jgi:hypothetical protein
MRQDAAGFRLSTQTARQFRENMRVTRCLSYLSPLALSGENRRNLQRRLRTLDSLVGGECRDSEMQKPAWPVPNLAPLAGRGRIAMTMRSVVIAIRVRGPLRVGGANEKARDTMNHRCRVASVGAPSPGIRALHARIPTSPRKRGEVRTSRAPRIFSPDSPARGEDRPIRRKKRCSDPTRLLRRFILSLK